MDSSAFAHRLFHFPPPSDPHAETTCACGNNNEVHAEDAELDPGAPRLWRWRGPNSGRRPGVPGATDGLKKLPNSHLFGNFLFSASKNGAGGAPGAPPSGREISHKTKRRIFWSGQSRTRAGLRLRSRRCVGRVSDRRAQELSPTRKAGAASPAGNQDLVNF